MTNQPTAAPDQSTDGQRTAKHTEPTGDKIENEHDIAAGRPTLLILTEGGDGFCEGDSCTIREGNE